MPANHPLTAEAIRRRQNELADAVVASLYQRQAGVLRPPDDAHRAKSVRDVSYHLTYLAEALAAGDPALFTDYLAWVKTLFSGLKFRQDILPMTLECTRQALDEMLEPELRPPALEYVEIGLKTCLGEPPEQESFIEADNPLSDLARAFINALLNADRHSASEMILQAARQGMPIKDIYLNVFQRSQWEIGYLWQTNQIGIAQEHYCTAATQMIMSQLYPYIFAGEKKGLRMAVVCVGGELHEIGARMVADFFEMDGWDTYFLGANTTTDSILQTLVEYQVDLLAISVTMTYHIGKVTDLIQQIRQNGLDQHTKVFVGGYPFNISPNLWQVVGADGTARDAQAAVAAAERLVKA